MQAGAVQRADFATRFSSDRQPVKTGRPRESRDKLTTRFLHEFADHFEANGKKAIETVYKEEPATYLKIAAALLPKEIEIQRPMAGLTEDQLGQVIAMLQQLSQQPKEVEAEVVSTT